MQMRANRPKQPWCRFSDTCMTVGIERHVAHPVSQDGRDLDPCIAGCPNDESACPSAQMCMRAQRRFEESHTRCAVCGQPFVPRNGAQIYCSQICADDARRAAERCQQ